MRYLFERIVAPSQPKSIELLKEDVRAQVQRLLDSHRIAQYRGGLDILNLSIPAVTEIGRHSVSDQTTYAAKIRKILMRYEPRLHNPEVAVIPSSNESMSPQLQINAELRIDGYVDSFHFSSEVDSL